MSQTVIAWQQADLGLKNSSEVGMSDGFDVVSVINAKGGAGKTSLTKVLISAALASGQKVVAFDCDPTQNLMGWVDKAKEAGNWPSNAAAFEARTAKEIVEALNQLTDEGFDGLVFVDTAGFGDKASLYMVNNSDFVILPIMLGSDSVGTTLETATVVTQMVDQLDEGKKAVVRVVRCNIPTLSNRRKGHSENFDRLGQHPLCLNAYISNSPIIELWTDEGPLHSRFKREENTVEGAKALNAKNTMKVLQEGLAVINELFEEAE